MRKTEMLFTFEQYLDVYLKSCNLQVYGPGAGSLDWAGRFVAN